MARPKADLDERQEYIADVQKDPFWSDTVKRVKQELEYSREERPDVVHQRGPYETTNASLRHYWGAGKAIDELVQHLLSKDVEERTTSEPQRLLYDIIEPLAESVSCCAGLLRTCRTFARRYSAAEVEAVAEDGLLIGHVVALLSLPAGRRRTFERLVTRQRCTIPALKQHIRKHLKPKARPRGKTKAKQPDERRYGQAGGKTLEKINSIAEDLAVRLRLLPAKPDEESDERASEKKAQKRRRQRVRRSLHDLLAATRDSIRKL